MRATTWMQALSVWVAIALGGAAGCAARHAVNVMVSRLTVHSVPIAVGVVNISGCFLIGLLAGAVATERWSPSSTTRAFVFVGVLGGYTTFSSFGLDTLTLVHQGRVAVAVSNAVIQVAVGTVAVFAGYAIAVR